MNEKIFSLKDGNIEVDISDLGARINAIRILKKDKVKKHYIKLLFTQMGV